MKAKFKSLKKIFKFTSKIYTKYTSTIINKNKTEQFINKLISKIINKKLIL